MKKIFNGLRVAAVLLAAVFFVSCEDDNKEDYTDMYDLDVTIPEWSVNPEGIQDLPALVFGSGETNLNDRIIEEVTKNAEVSDPLNIIFMFFNGISDELISSAAQKYEDAGGVLLSSFPEKLTFTAPALNENTDSQKVPGLYLDKIFKKGAYLTTGSIVNNVFRQFKGTYSSDSDVVDIIDDLVTKLPRPVFFLAKDTDSDTAKIETSPSSSAYTNEFYKSMYKVVYSFKDAVDCFDNQEVLIEGFDANHVDEYVEPRGVYTIYPASARVYPSPLESMAYALAYTESNREIETGFYVVFYDDAAGSDKEAELKEFDEAVIAASKYVLENPDTILVVTDSAFDGSEIPAYVLGTVSDEAKTAGNLLDFLKAVIKK